MAIVANFISFMKRELTFSVENKIVHKILVQFILQLVSINIDWTSPFIFDELKFD